MLALKTKYKIISVSTEKLEWIVEASDGVCLLKLYVY